MAARVSFNKPQGQPVLVNQSSNLSGHAGQSPPSSYVRTGQGVRESGVANVKTSGVAAAPYGTTTGSNYVHDPRVSGHTSGPYHTNLANQHSSYRESEKPIQEKQVHHGYRHDSKRLSSDQDQSKKGGCSPVIFAIIGLLALALLILALLFGLGVIGGNHPDPNNTTNANQVAAISSPASTTTSETTKTTKTTTTTNSNANNGSNSGAVAGSTGVSASAGNSNGYYDSKGNWVPYSTGTSLRTQSSSVVPATVSPLYAPAS